MVGLNSFAVTAAAALSLVSGSYATRSLIGERTFPLFPSCVNFADYKYAGCYTDPQSPRALPLGSNIDFGSMTPDLCIAFCKGNGYRYAGLEYYGQCFCGEAVAGVLSDDLNCQYPCNGDPTKLCGGNSYISVYQDPTYPPSDPAVITDYMASGCWSDDLTHRTLAVKQDAISNTASMTTELCLQTCKTQGYPLAGTEFGSECWCGIVLGNFTTQQSDSACTMPCSGDPTGTEICGGPALLDLYVATDLESLQPCTSFVGSSSSSTTASSTTSTSTTASSTTSTTSTTTSTSSTTTSKPTTTATTTSPLCTTTLPPKCEYKIGNWCAPPLPPWGDKPGCDAAAAHCKVQCDTCWGNNNWPTSGNCKQYSDWCDKIAAYCTNSNQWTGGKCFDTDCKSKNPPPYTPSTTVGPCKTTSTSTKPTTTTTCPVPTYSPICKQPSNKYKGYDTNAPVGGIRMPCVQCNNKLDDYNAGNWFKLYTNPDSGSCASYNNRGVPQACKDACLAQYNSCKNTYAQSCKGKFQWGNQDSYDSANTKCWNQYQDCLSINKNTSPSSNRCKGYNSNWSDNWSGNNDVNNNGGGWTWGNFWNGWGW